MTRPNDEAEPRTFICANIGGDSPTPSHGTVRHYEGPHGRGEVGEWTTRTRRCRCADFPHNAVEHRRKVGDFELMVDDDAADGLTWSIALGGNDLFVSWRSANGKGTLAWKVEKAKSECEKEARRMGLAIPPRAAEPLGVAGDEQ